MSALLREDGARCYHAGGDEHADGQHGARCYCGRPATRHVYYGTGCGNVCGVHARSILRRKHLELAPPNLVNITPGAPAPAVAAEPAPVVRRARGARRGPEPMPEQPELAAALARLGKERTENVRIAESANVRAGTLLEKMVALLQAELAAGRSVNLTHAAALTKVSRQTLHDRLGPTRARAPRRATS